MENPQDKFQGVQFDTRLPRYTAANNELAKIRIFERGYDTYLRPFIKRLRERLKELLGR